MNEKFIPEVAPPIDHPADALCFAFCGDKLLVHLRDGGAIVPTHAELAESPLSIEREHFLGQDAHNGPCFAADLGDEIEAPAGMAFYGLRDLADRLGDDLFSVGGRAVQIVNWGRTHRFCGRCGTETETAPSERAQVCPACGLMCFPRLSPAIIVRITKGELILLARNHRFPTGRFSVLAGFVEPGESLEEAVAREVREEVGIRVRNIRYFDSQPWPFPNSLMLGFTSEYAEGELVIQEDELDEAHWFGRDELPDLPPAISIARRLIDDFVGSQR